MHATDESMLAARPAGMPAALDELYRIWLEPNGIGEYLPEGVAFTVEPAGWISYQGFAWPEGRGGWDAGVLLAHEVYPAMPEDSTRAALTPRHVPLRVPVNDRVRALFAQLQMALIEVEV